VLYQTGDTAWDEQVAARRTFDAVSWVQARFGPYVYPQLTNLHRLDGGGTEFPMMVMDGDAGQSLITHEVTHQWLHGILANNEWRQGWLDEGFTSFITSWYLEAHGDTAAWLGTMRTLERLERSDSTQVVDQPGEAFRSPRMYTAMTYTKTAAVMRMLRYLLGAETFDRVLHTYYDRYRVGHVTGADFQRVAEQVSGRDLDWFFGQWLQRTDRLDYGIASVSSSRGGDGRWRTRVEVLRAGRAWMPVVVRAGTAERRLEGRERRQTVVLVTAQKPAEVWLDREWILIDPDRSNNRAVVP
jgi:aminopeptidase N